MLIDGYKKDQSLEVLYRPIQLLTEAIKSDSRFGIVFFDTLEKALQKTMQHKLAEEMIKVYNYEHMLLFSY